VNYIHKAGIVPPDECESESDVHVVQNWQIFCPKMGDAAIVE
jgi:hypothetical protein